eukprot:2621044-Alexandrium_andersonii.AAC.1
MEPRAWSAPGPAPRAKASNPAESRPPAGHFVRPGAAAGHLAAVPSSKWAWIRWRWPPQPTGPQA